MTGRHSPLLAKKQSPRSGLNGKLFAKLADKGLLGSLAGLEFSSGKLPFQGIPDGPPSLTGKDSLVSDEDTYCDFFHPDKCTKNGKESQSSAAEEKCNEI